MIQSEVSLEHLAIGELEKLIQSIKDAGVGVLPIRASVFDGEFAASPTARDGRAKASLDSEAPLSFKRRFEAGSNDRRKSRIINSADLGEQAEFEWTASRIHQAGLPAEDGRSFEGGFLLIPRAGIRLVLRRSEAGRQQSQEENPRSQLIP